MDVITATGLVKVYRSRRNEVRALDGLDLTVEEGAVLGLLGPNGAGKTTTVRILATLMRPDAGSATIAGFDLVRDAQRIRSIIGLSGQYAAVDENLTGRENLEMFGRLYGLPSAQARRRAGDLLDQYDLEDAAGRTVKTYSGGMRRRLDLASAIIVRPRLLFLDEPTTGLDPRSRIRMWENIRELVGGGATLLLTTQYLEEADALADSIAVVDHGRIIARGTADQLKSRIGGERVEVVLSNPADLHRAAEAVARHGEQYAVDEGARRITIPTDEGVPTLLRIGRELDELGVPVEDIGIHRPTLDDVFLVLTGHAAAPASENDTEDAPPTTERTPARAG
ncbi:MAG: ATP-binding cassette domain-containing protein [Dehalococcoidia bacterium]